MEQIECITGYGEVIAISVNSNYIQTNSFAWYFNEAKEKLNAAIDFLTGLNLNEVQGKVISELKNKIAASKLVRLLNNLTSISKIKDITTYSKWRELIPFELSVNFRVIRELDNSLTQLFNCL